MYKDYLVGSMVKTPSATASIRRKQPSAFVGYQIRSWSRLIFSLIDLTAGLWYQP
jgi:hypothetical protein